MTIPSTPRKAGPYQGNGVQTAWPFGFKCFSTADVAVRLYDPSVGEVLLDSASYTVVLNSNQDTSPGGTVTYPNVGEPIASGYRLVVVGGLEYDQPLDIPAGGNFSPVALENELDRIVMQVQQMAEVNGRAVTVPPTFGDLDSTDLPAPEANALIGWNSTATSLENKPGEAAGFTVAYGERTFDTFTGNGSQTTFSLTSPPANIADVDLSVDGATLVPGTDYTLASNVLTFTTAPINGAEILARYGRVPQSLPFDVVSAVRGPFLLLDNTISYNFSVPTGKNALSISPTIADGTTVTVPTGSKFITLDEYTGGGSGEANTGTNVGTGLGLYAGKVGTALQFRSLIAGSNITLTPDGTSVTIASTGGGSGEANTASNLGTGVGLFASKSGVNLGFKSLVAGSNITLTPDANSVVVSASNSGEANTVSNIGTGTGLYASKVGVDFRLRSLAVSTGLSLASDGSTITLTNTAPGETNTASNLGASGEGVFASKSGVDLQFKKLKAGSNVTLTSDSSSITIAASGGSGLTEFSSYAALRAYSGTTTPVRVTAPAMAGFFYLDAADTTSTDNGGTVIVDGTGRRWKREYTGPVKAAWFGAVGGGTDCTAAITAAFAASDAVHLEDWYYVSSGFSIPSGRSFTLTGIGQSSSGLWYTGATGATLLTFAKSYSDKHVMTVSNVGFRSQVAGNTAIKIQAALTGASTQVNGQTDSALLSDVTISSESASYWTTGIHIVNGGGVHLNRVKIENSDSAEAVSGVRGIYIQNTDSRVYMIRTLTATDFYIVRVNAGIETSSVTTTGGIESMYLTSGEIIANTGLKCAGHLSAVRISGTHMDVINGAIDCAAAHVAAFRVVGCDFRKSNNGGSYTAGPLLSFDFGEGVDVTGCFLSGVEEVLSSTLNVAVKFSNTIYGTGLNRSSFTGNTFRSHYYVFGVTPTVNSVTAAGNSYGGIAGAVNQNTDEDTSIAKQDSVVSYSFIASLNTSGDQAITHTPPNTLRYFTGAHLIVVPTIASAHSQQLSVSYDYDASSNSSYVFRVKGNTAGVQNVRISYIAYGQAVAA